MSGVNQTEGWFGNVAIKVMKFVDQVFTLVKNAGLILFGFWSKFIQKVMIILLKFIGTKCTLLL